MQKDSNFYDKIHLWSGEFDENLSETENLLYQMNFDNDTDFIDTDVTLGPPIKTKDIAVSPQDPNATIETNTKVLVTATLTSDYKGYDYYHYRRLDLQVLWQIFNKSLIKIPEYVETDEDILDFFKNKIPLLTQSVSILKYRQDNRDYITLKAKPNSYLYIGEVSIPVAYSTKIRGFDYTTV